MTNFDCKDIKAILSGLVDGEIEADSRHNAERHIADCKACREMIDEAERVNELVALEAQRLLWPVGLPAGFENAVLSRTAYTDAYNFAGRRWTSWLGWVAAAASLLLALSIWMLDQRPTTMEPQPVARGTNPLRPSNAFVSASHLRSWTSDAALPADAVRASFAAANGGLDRATQLAIDEQLALVQPTSRRIAMNTLTRDDSDTLFAASNLLEMLTQADLNSFADVERIRRIAEYDNLLDRLAEARDHVNPADRPVVMAAESVLMRIVNGPLDLNDVQTLNQTVSRMELATELEEISGLMASTL